MVVKLLQSQVDEHCHAGFIQIWNFFARRGMSNNKNENGSGNASDDEDDFSLSYSDTNSDGNGLYQSQLMKNFSNLFDTNSSTFNEWQVLEMNNLAKIPLMYCIGDDIDDDEVESKSKLMDDAIGDGDDCVEKRNCRIEMFLDTLVSVSNDVLRYCVKHTGTRIWWKWWKWWKWNNVITY